VLAALLAIPVLPASIVVAAAPVAAGDGPHVVLEDGLLDLAVPGVLGNDSDADIDPLSAVLDADVSNGTLALNADGSFEYEPDPDFNGADSFTYHALAGGEDSNTATVSITVTPVNDAPSFAAGGDVNVAEDSGAYDASWATSIGAGPANEAGQTVAFLVVNDANGLFSAQPAIDGAGQLTFTPAADASGAAEVTVTASDDGGTGNGGDDTADPATFTITIGGVNDAPVAPGDAVSTNEDVPLTFDLDATDPEGDVLAIAIVDQPTNGDVSLGATICGGGTCSRSVTYTPDPDFSGSDSFTFAATEALTDPALSSNSATVSVTVNAANDGPTFTTGPDQVVLEDAGPQSGAGWATGFDPGPADEGTQGLVEYVVSSNTNPGLFSAAPTVALDGTLTWTPAADANGVATIGIRARDDGGTVNGGTDLGAEQAFTITVTAVNDPPSFTKGADDTVAEDSGAQSVADWATAISAGPADESGQAVAFEIVSNGNTALFGSGPAVSSTGTLTWTPAANRNGTATIQLRIMDDGGVDNGGSNASPGQSFTITVNAVNDPPNAVNDVSFSVVAGSGATALDVLANDSSAPDTGETLTIVGATQGAHGIVAIIGGGTGLTYQPSAFFEGTDIVTYTISDGSLTDTATVLVTVVPVGGVGRLAGPDRYATAAAISAATFPVGVPVAYVATGGNFPDALAGAAAGGFRGGPVLLVTQSTIPQATLTELARLQPFKVVVLGSVAVVGEAVAEALRPYTTSGVVERYAGPDRYATAAAISAATFATGAPVAYIATGANFPDALAGAAAGGFRGGPVLLVTQFSIPAATLNELARLQPYRVVVLGSTGVVGDAVAAALVPYTTSGVVERLAGPDRYATAAAISAATFTPGVPVAYIATATNFPDALAGAAAGGHRGGPVLLVNPAVAALPAATAAELARLKPRSIIVLGSAGAVPDSIFSLLAPYAVAP
jgi:VCBS repeat-containing protein